MEMHGVKFSSDRDKLARSIGECGMAYLHAPLFNPALKAVAPVRKSLAVRSFFNLLGPLVNPAKPAYQLLGVYNLPLLRLYSYTYQQSGVRFGVVHSMDGYDEISLTSEFKVTTAESEKVYTPEMLGMERCREEELYGGDSVEEASRIFDDVLQTKASRAKMNCVITNAAFAIRVINPQKSIEQCIDEARNSLYGMKALEVFNKFLSLNS